MDKEIWKDIEGYEGLYQVSNFGRVRSLDKYKNQNCGGKQFMKGKILKSFLNTQKYVVIHLTKNGVEKNFRIHRLVAKAFINNPERKPEVNHIDGNKQNNYVTNLEWVTASENIKHSITKNLKVSSKGTMHYKSTFSSETIRQIRKEYIPRDKQFGCNALAQKYGTQKSVIWKIVNNKSYSDIK